MGEEIGDLVNSGKQQRMDGRSQLMPPFLFVISFISDSSGATFEVGDRSRNGRAPLFCSFPLTQVIHAP